MKLNLEDAADCLTGEMFATIGLYGEEVEFSDVGDKNDEDVFVVLFVGVGE